jgi:hypothetical protein
MSTGTNADEGDQISLFLPPPTYDEVITTNLYPPTPQMLQRRVCESVNLLNTIYLQASSLTELKPAHSLSLCDEADRALT